MLYAQKDLTGSYYFIYLYVPLRLKLRSIRSLYLYVEIIIIINHSFVKLKCFPWLPRVNIFQDYQGHKIQWKKKKKLDLAFTGARTWPACEDNIINYKRLGARGFYSFSWLELDIGLLTKRIDYCFISKQYAN